MAKSSGGTGRKGGTVRTRTPLAERVARAEDRMAVQAQRASSQQSAAFVAARKARAEGNTEEAARQTAILNNARFREYQVGRRARQIRRIASPD